MDGRQPLVERGTQLLRVVLCPLHHRLQLLCHRILQRGKLSVHQAARCFELVLQGLRHRAQLGGDVALERFQRGLCGLPQFLSTLARFFHGAVEFGVERLARCLQPLGRGRRELIEPGVQPLHPGVEPGARLQQRLHLLLQQPQAGRQVGRCLEARPTQQQHEQQSHTQQAQPDGGQQQGFVGHVGILPKGRSASIARKACPLAVAAPYNAGLRWGR